MITAIRKRFGPVDGAGFAALAIITGVWYFAALAPTERQYAAFAGMESTLAERSAELARWDSQLAAARRDHNLLAADAGKVVQFKTRSALNARLGEIPGVAEARGITLDELAPGAVVSAAGQRFEQTPIRLSGSAPYRAVEMLLTELHVQFPDMEVTRLALAGQPENPGAPARFAIELVWYTIPVSAAGAGESRPPARGNP